MAIKILFFLFFSINIFSSEIYTPKNVKEQLYLEKIRKEEFILGIQESELADQVLDGKSLNYIIEDLFKNYLNLNIKIKKSNGIETYKNFENGDIDGIGLITRNFDRKDFTEFSKKIFSENLYLASKNKKFNSLEEIRNKKIYIHKNDPEKYQLLNYLKNQGVNNEIIEVENLMDYLENIVLISGFYANGIPNKLKIGHIPDTSIGVSKKYSELLPIINNALVEKYEDEIKNHLNRQKLETQRIIFREKLTDEEREYLKKVKEISIGLEVDSSLSKYSTITKEYMGPFPKILKKTSEILEIPHVNKSTLKSNWTDLYEKFKNKEIQVLPVSLLNSKFNEYLFSDILYPLRIFLITNTRLSSDNIGVIQNSVYEDIAKKYFFEERIIQFSSNQALLDAFRNSKVNGILSSYIDDFDNESYDIEELDTIPIVLVFQKEDEILRDIFNKALSSIGKMEISNLIYQGYQDEKREILREKDKVEKTSEIFMGISIFGLIIIFLLAYKFISERKISKTLRKDFLTGLPNRVLFNEFCQIKFNAKGITILIDLNNFKQVNDNFNYKQGDQILLEFSCILKDIFKEDYIFRISGDEFYGFIVEENYKIKMKNLRDRVSSSRILESYNVSFSLGYYLKKETDKFEDAFKYAGMAMREGKLKEKCAIVKASPELIEAKTRELKLKEILKTSLEGMYPVFQPKIRSENQIKIVGAEALCRWKNREFGEITPKEFIPLAEDLKIIHLIDFKIAEESIKFLAELKDENQLSKDFKISFNLSMQTFERKDTVKKLEKLLAKYGILGEKIEIEITESIISTNLSQTLEKLKKLKDLGINISLDDFTAGYSTTSLLPVLPIDVLKFDKSLVDLYKNNRNKGSIIYKTLIKMAKDLNLKTVAEGIESNEEYAFLKQEGINIFQGFLFGKPMTKDEFKKGNF